MSSLFNSKSTLLAACCLVAAILYLLSACYTSSSAEARCGHWEALINEVVFSTYHRDQHHWWCLFFLAELSSLWQKWPFRCCCVPLQRLRWMWLYCYWLSQIFSVPDVRGCLLWPRNFKALGFFCWCSQYDREHTNVLLLMLGSFCTCNQQ